jgi:hypothetical protein
MTNPTWTDLGEKQVLCGDRPVTNCLNHGTAYLILMEPNFMILMEAANLWCHKIEVKWLISVRNLHITNRCARKNNIVSIGGMVAKM